jgi:drug/metabolite transporter (DMT)-like permease
MSSAPLMVALSSLLFATMGVCVKLASAHYSAGEIVLYRAPGGRGAHGRAGALQRGVSLRTACRRCTSGAAWQRGVALLLWFYAIGGLPLATAMTLNYMSSVWMALFLIGGAVMLGAARVDGRLVAAVLAGFAGVALVLQPTHAARPALARPGRPVVGLALGAGLPAGDRTRSPGRARNPRGVLLLAGGHRDRPGLDAGRRGQCPHTCEAHCCCWPSGCWPPAAQLMMTHAYRIGHTLTNASLQYLGLGFSFAFGVLLFGDAVTASALGGMVLIVGAGLYATLLRSREQHDSPDTRSPPNDT